ncbi:hypothetical protein DH2020_044181 [Rehmannia glutinosa]|uniref:Uncharacterized protein n=1 Tax=Rehmannia glutinosa TaxID=99300 RepID=A0ABR0UHN5_REHGL
MAVVAEMDCGVDLREGEADLLPVNLFMGPIRRVAFNSNFATLRQPTTQLPSSSSDATSFAHAMVDREKLPTRTFFQSRRSGPRKEEVKVELEDDRFCRLAARESGDGGEERYLHRVERSGGLCGGSAGKCESGGGEGEYGERVLIILRSKVDGKKPDVKSIDISC